MFKPFEFKPVTIAGMKVKNVDYHRNGVSGEGFYCAVVGDRDNGDMLITYFHKAKGICCAVYKLDLLPDIAFGTNSWRGDNYVDVMKEAIKEYDKQFDRWLESRVDNLRDSVSKEQK